MNVTTDVIVALSMQSLRLRVPFLTGDGFYQNFKSNKEILYRISIARISWKGFPRSGKDVQVFDSSPIRLYLDAKNK